MKNQVDVAVRNAASALDLSTMTTIVPVGEISETHIIDSIRKLCGREEKLGKLNMVECISQSQQMLEKLRRLQSLVKAAKNFDSVHLTNGSNVPAVQQAAAGLDAAFFQYGSDYSLLCTPILAMRFMREIEMIPDFVSQLHKFDLPAAQRYAPACTLDLYKDLMKRAISVHVCKCLHEGCTQDYMYNVMQAANGVPHRRALLDHHPMLVAAHEPDPLLATGDRSIAGIS